MSALRQKLTRNLLLIHATVWISFVILLAVDIYLGWPSLWSVPIPVFVFLICAPLPILSSWFSSGSGVETPNALLRRFVRISPWFLGMQWICFIVFTVMLIRAYSALRLP
jgi:hypothetical protein